MSIKEKVHPNIWKKKNYQDIILYALSAYGPLTRSECIREGNEVGKINKTTFYKYLNKLIEKKYVRVKKEGNNVEYFITNSGEIQLSKRKFEYDLDFQSLLEIEERKSKNLIKRLSQFFQNNKIEDNELKIEYINLASNFSFEELNLPYEEDQFNKLLLFLVLNYPKFFNKYSVSINLFLNIYNEISTGKLTKNEIELFLERSIYTKDYGFNFHILKLPLEGIELFFSENSEYGKKFEFEVDSRLKKYVHSVNLGISENNQEEILKVYNDIVFTLVYKYKLFDSRLKEPLYDLIEDYRRKIKEDAVKKTSDIEKYVVQIPERPSDYKISLIESLDITNSLGIPDNNFTKFLTKWKEKNLNLNKTSHDSNVEVYHSSLRDLKYYSKDNLIKKAWELYDKQDYEGTLVNINKALSLEQNPEYYYWQAEILGLNLRKYDKSLEAIEKGIKINPIPGGFNFYRLKAEILSKNYDYEAALIAINKALEFDSQEKLIEAKSKILVELMRYDDAIKLSENFRLIKKNILSDQLYEKAYKLSWEKGQITNALETIDRALDLDHKSEFYYLKTKILKDLKNYDEALKTIEKAIGLSPRNTKNLREKANILKKVKEFDEALNIINEAVELSSKDPGELSDNLMEKARILKQVKEFEKSLEMIDQAISELKRSGEPDIITGELYHEKALILKDGQKYERALKVIELVCDSREYPMDYKLKAEILTRLNKFEDALDSINDAINIWGNPQYFYLKVEILINLKKFDQVFIVLHSHEGFEENRHDYTPIYSYAAEQLIFNDQIDLASKVLEEGDKFEPKGEASLRLMINLERHIYHILDKGKNQEVLELVDKCLNIREVENNPQIYDYRITALTKLKRFENAIDLVENAIKRWPDYPSIIWEIPAEKELTKEETEKFQKFFKFYRSKAKILISMNNNEEALETIEKVIRLNPFIADAYFIKSIILFNTQKYKESVNQIKKAIELNPHREDHYQLKAKILYELDQNNEAIKMLDKSIELNPNIPENYYLKAKFLFYSNKFNEALKTINDGFELYPEHLEYYEIKNLILESLGRREEALEGIDKAIKLGAKYKGLYYNKASLQDYFGRYNVALETINKELELNPNDSFSITLKIRILNELENFDQALNLLESNKELMHDDDSRSDSYNNLKAEIFYTKAKIFARNNMKEEAIMAIEAALQLTDQEWADYTYKYGEIMMMFHDYEVAAEKFESALKLHIPPLDTRIKLGRCYFEIGQFDKALQNLEGGKYQAEHSVKQEVRDEDVKIIQMDILQKKLIEEADLLIRGIHSLLLKLKSPSFKTEIYFNIGDYFVSRGNYDLAIEYFKVGREFAIHRKESKWIEKAEHEFKRYNSFVEDFKRDLMR